MSSRRVSRVRLASVVAALLIICITMAVTGCGQRKNHPFASISGKVTIGGKPLPGGIIVFTLNENPNIMGTVYVRGDGSYQGTKVVPVGACKVTVKTSHLNPIQPAVKPGDPPPKPPEHYVQMSGDAKTGKMYTPIPAKYEKIESTTLTFDVVDGDNTYEIKLDEK